MNKLRVLLGLGLGWIGAFSATGQSVATAPTASWTLAPSVVSQYMFRGTKLGGPAFQPTVEFGYGAWTAGVWASVPLDNTVPGVSDPEYDLYGAYTMTVNDQVSVVLGATWYLYPEADTAAGFYEQTFEPSIALNYTVGGVRLTPKLYYDTGLEGATAELTAAYAVPLQKLGTELNFAATVGAFKWNNTVENASPAVRNWGNYWSAGVSLPFQLTANGKLIAGLAYHRGDDNFTKEGTAPKVENSAAVGRGVVSLAYSVTF
jgi:uncharacterized protein (TIGR02001 family)